MKPQILANLELFLRELSILTSVNRHSPFAQANEKNIFPVNVLAVSKTFPEQAIRIAYQNGFSAFGENYVQEAINKMKNLQDLPLCWHLIGHLQKNKAKLVAQHFDWVETVDSVELAVLLSRHREGVGRLLDICVQVNIDNAPTKSGVSVDQAAVLCRHILQLPHLRLRGVMVMPDFGNQMAEHFERARLLFKSLRTELFGVSPPDDFDTLSMGISADYQQAIAQGSTQIRVGRIIFGDR
jgi:pyridoxal phosphate enzyme (YggS family)